MATFVLRNTHRYQALSLAVRRLDSTRTNPMYRRRELIVDEIVARAWAILKEASLAHDGYADFVASGLAKRVTELDLGTLAPAMVGRYGMHTGTEIWPVVVKTVHAGMFLQFDPKARTAVTASGMIVSFHGLNAANLLPCATLAAALTIKMPERGDNLRLRQREIQRLIDEDLAAVNAEIAAVFDDLPAIADSIAQCHTSADLYAVFPAAESLFDDATPAADPRARQVLAAL